MKFDWTITFGNVLVMLSIVTTATSFVVAYYYKGQQSGQVVRERLDRLEEGNKELKELTDKCLDDKLEDRTTLKIYMAVKDQAILNVQNELKGFREELKQMWDEIRKRR